MYLSRDSFVYKTAYWTVPVSRRPTGTINGCNLFWRFIWFGATLSIATSFLLVFTPVVIVCLILKSLYFLSIGNGLHFQFSDYVARTLSVSINKPVESLRLGDKDILWQDKLLYSLWPANWHPHEIKRWPRIFGLRVLPLAILSTLFAVFCVWLMVWMNIHILKEVLVGDLEAILILLVESALILLVVSFFAFHWLKKTPVAQLAGANLRSFKDRTCPVVEIVD